jgi:hypothetical protein
MALSEARAKASSEFERVLESTHRPIEEIREFVAESPELRHPLHPIPHTPGVVSTAASFVLYANQLMDMRRKEKARSWVWLGEQSNDAALGRASSKGE